MRKCIGRSARANAQSGKGRRALGAKRFFVDGSHELGATVRLAASDAHKLRNVLRAKDGDAVEVVDSTARCFRAVLRLAGENVLLQLEAILAQPGRHELRRAITLAQAIPKSTKMDFVVEKATELGVTSILPFHSERSVAIASGTEKLERWRRLARSAAQQSGRDVVPTVTEPLEFGELLLRFPDFECVLLPWELHEVTGASESLADLIAATRSVLVVIGPEGGFAHGEVDAAIAAGAHVLSLGKRILRTETASLAMLAILGYLDAVAA